MITPELIRELLDYDPDTGQFRWRKNGKPAGGVTFSSSRRNRPYRFVNIKIRGKNIKAHRAAWAHVYGKWPDHVVDHRDRNSLNNAITNLRDVTLSENTKNTPRCDRVVDTREPLWHIPASNGDTQRADNRLLENLRHIHQGQTESLEA